METKFYRQSNVWINSFHEVFLILQFFIINTLFLLHYNFIKWFWTKHRLTSCFLFTWLHDFLLICFNSSLFFLFEFQIIRISLFHFPITLTVLSLCFENRITKNSTLSGLNERIYFNYLSKCNSICTNISNVSLFYKSWTPYISLGKFSHTSIIYFLNSLWSFFAFFSVPFNYNVLIY